MMDDGAWNTGRMRTDGTDPDYTLASDCWSLSGQTNFHMLLLP